MRCLAVVLVLLLGSAHPVSAGAMSIAWTRVKVITPVTTADSEFHAGVTCLGSQSGLMYTEESDESFGTGNDKTRFFRTTDNGVTWTETPTPLSSPNDFPNGSRLRVASAATPLLGAEGVFDSAQPWDAGSTMIVRSTDGGLAWQSAISSATYNLFKDFGYGVYDFVVTDSGDIYALGFFAETVNTDHYMKSTDGGASFSSPLPIDPGNPASAVNTLTAGVDAGGGVILFSGGRTQDTAHGAGGIWRSTDSAASFTSVFPGGLIVSVSALARVSGSGGSAVILAGGIAASDRPVLLRSTDGGANWGAVSVPAANNNVNVPVGDVIRVSDTHAVAQFSIPSAGAGSITSGGRPFVLSTDGGTTWADLGTYSPPLVVGQFYTARQLAVMDDGSIIGVTVTTVAGVVNTEIWRGVISGFVGAGPCAAFAQTVVEADFSAAGAAVVEAITNGVVPSVAEAAGTSTAAAISELVHIGEGGGSVGLAAGVATGDTVSGVTAGSVAHAEGVADAEAAEGEPGGAGGGGGGVGDNAERQILLVIHSAYWTRFPLATRTVPYLPAPPRD